MWTIEKAGGRRAGSGRERALPADPACRPLAFSIVLTVLTESLEQAIASYADILWARRARLRKGWTASEGRLRDEPKKCLRRRPATSNSSGTHS